MQAINLPDLAAIRSFLVYLARRYREDGCAQRAAALTYMSLFALVPLMTVVYAVAAMVPAFHTVGDLIQDYLFTNLVPSSGTQIQEYLLQFSNQAKNLTGVGITVLIVTAILMLRSIEQAFNAIWRTESGRSGAAAFLLYWAVLSLAPLCVGAALAITTYLTSLPLLFGEIDVVGAGLALLNYLPGALGVVACTLIYITVPNCRVPFTHALAGSVVVILLFQIAQELFTLIVVGSNYAFIYGAFAALPLFLLWLHLTWQIVLFGGILVHAMSAYQRDASGQHALIVEATALLRLLWSEQLDGAGVSEARLLHETVEGLKGPLSSRHWDLLKERLMEHRVLRRADNGEYFLSRDLNSLNLWQLKQILDNRVDQLPHRTDNEAPWLHDILNLLEQAREEQQSMLQPSLAQLFGERT